MSEPSPRWTPAAEPVVDCAVYVGGRRRPGVYSPRTAWEAVQDTAGSFVWLGLHQPDQERMAEVGELFGLHPLVVENALQPYRRPALERYDDSLFLVIKTVHHVPAESATETASVVETAEIMVCLGPRYAITVRHGNFEGLSGIRTELEGRPELLTLGPGTVLCTVAGHIVETYLSVLEQLETEIDQLRIQVLADGRPGIDVEALYLLKREMIELRRGIGPLSGALHRLVTHHRDLLPTAVTGQLRRLIDRERSAAEQILALDRQAGELVEGALGQAGVQQNAIMRTISAWGSLVVIVTMISGIYGMRFSNMPETHWAWGYRGVLGLMTGICAALYVYFRRRRWL
jgi:magnesium transporter